MTCLDYDLCESCEIKGIHPGHNMMRLATPKSAWPGHFINRLNRYVKDLVQNLNTKWYFIKTGQGKKLAASKKFT